MTIAGRWWATIVVMLVLAGPSGARSDTAAGLAAYERGDHERAFRAFREAAESGDLRAQYNLAQFYRLGVGTEPDPAAARRWYARAAGRGLSSAQHNLAQMYMQGAGGPVDLTQAVAWWRRAAHQDHAAAQYNLAKAYETGLGIGADRREALFWYSVALVGGYMGAHADQQRVAAGIGLEALEENARRVHAWRAEEEPKR